jgi:hypothetical protein
LDQIPFNFDTIKTRNGSIVQERRGTAWVVSDDDIGSLAYSGKLMNPNPIPPIVTSAMQQVEHAIFSHKQWQDSTLLSQHEDGRNHHRENDIVSMRDQLCYEETGRYFDCVLCNHYPNDDAACKFHTDPEHGTYWERLTCVVSASGKRGIRKFAFRPIPEESFWSEWEEIEIGDSGVTGANTKENKKKRNTTGHQSGKKGDNGEEVAPAVVPLFSGDVVSMWGQCNDMFHHAVY